MDNFAEKETKLKAQRKAILDAIVLASDKGDSIKGLLEALETIERKLDFVTKDRSF